MAEPRDRRLDILFACGREPDYIRNQMLRQALARQNHVTVTTEPVHPAAWRYLKAFGKTAGQLRRSPDVLMVGFYGQPLVPALRPLTRRPLILDAYVSTYDTLCSDRQRFQPGSIAGSLAFALDRWSCTWADHLLFDTQAHRDFFIETFGLLPAKTSVVYVGCDESHFMPYPTSSPAKTFEVFTYSSFLRLHGVEHILHAAQLLAGHKDIRFTIAGAGDRLRGMQCLAADIGLENVHFAGWVPFDELPARIAQADLCLGGHFSDVPKATRVIATKTFQFLAMGRPTIVGDNSASREVLVHGRHAYLCPMANPAALAAAILELRDDDDLRCRLAEEGLALYRERFTVAATASTLETLLAALVL